MLVRITNTDGWADWARYVKGSVVEIIDESVRVINPNVSYRCRFLVPLKNPYGNDHTELTIDGKILKPL